MGVGNLALKISSQPLDYTGAAMTTTSQLAKMYTPADVEPEIARRWDDAGAFHSEPDDPGEPYCIVIPPPNVTAALHMGHALNNTLQDVLIRWRRMCGDNTLWIPGTDHAGIATQTVVEKRVLAEQGKRRTDFTRDEFVAKIQAWKDEYESQITAQLKAMGCSCDWDRQRFTMDDVCARAVREAFFRLFQDRLIYRGKRLVNWDPATQTALADDEVEMRDIDGHFYYLRYPLAEPASGCVEYVTVATTRPETMLGDTAVAVNPKDPRAAALRGKMVRLPIVNRVVPIIEDDYVVLPDADSSDEKARYSSGFLKVTPAHDPNDYEIGQRFDLAMINVMAPDGTISDQHGWPAEDFVQGDAGFLLGMDRYEARKAVVDWLGQNNLLEGVKPYRHAVGHSYRSHVAIEPYLSDQWYVKVTDPRLSGAALQAMSLDQRGADHNTATGGRGQPQPPATASWQGNLQFAPARYANTFRAWHENIRDWCISRQLWWGHRIPVWHLSGDISGKSKQEHETFGESLIKLRKENRVEVYNRSIEDGTIDQIETGDMEDVASILRGASAYVCIRDPNDPEAVDLIEDWGGVQDPDVLDTWFSSGLWPISTLGWPDEDGNNALHTWNPSNVLCTAREIITLWVSRMTMLNIYFRGCLPFTDVFIHAMIQDGEGRKMSKSLGNGVNPLDIIHSHGTDAMRFTLVSMTTNTQDVRMPVTRDPDTGRNTSDKFDLGRNFANKLWNATRFALSHLAPDESPGAAPGGSAGAKYPLADRWILSRLAHAVRAANEALGNFEFSQYAQDLYDFFWRDFCDWYIETVKPTVANDPDQRRVLATCLDVVLRLLHPVMPFVTEKLWEHLNATVPDRGVEAVTILPHELLVRAPWPKVDDSLIDEDAERAFASLQAHTAAIREIRTSHQIPPRETVTYAVETGDDELTALLAPYIKTLANAETGPAPAKLPAELAGLTLVGTAQVAQRTLGVYRASGGADADAEENRMTKRLEEVQRSVKTLEGRLNNKGYTEKAPPHLVQQTRDDLDEKKCEESTLKEQLAAL